MTFGYVSCILFWMEIGYILAKSYQLDPLTGAQLSVASFYIKYYAEYTFDQAIDVANGITRIQWGDFHACMVLAPPHLRLKFYRILLKTKKDYV